MTQFQLAEPNAAYEDFDGEAVMLDLGTGSYFSLSKSASFVVAALLNGVELEEIIARCDGTRHLTSRAIQGLIEQLMDAKLITQALQTSPLITKIFEFPAIIDDVLIFERYDDLAEMIVADPIHEVDEQRGWPALKKERQ
jgi:hypothetical protein